MADHLSIKILGVLSGVADGPLAVGALGVIALAVLALTVRGLGDSGRKWLLPGRREEEPERTDAGKLIDPESRVCSGARFPGPPSRCVR